MNLNLKKEKGSGLFFSLIAVVFLFTTLIRGALLSLVQDENFAKIIGSVCSAISALIVVFIFCYFTEEKPFKNIGFKPFDKKYLLLSVTLFLGVLFGLGKINIWFADLLKNLGIQVPNGELPLESAFWLILTIIAVGFLPAFFEEVMFRGYILSGLKELKEIYVILISGLTFSLFHGSITQIIYQFLGGMIFALLTLRANSIFPAMIMHLLNNVTIILLTYFFPTVNFFVWWTVLVGFLLLIGSLGYLIFFCKKEKDKTDEKSCKGFFIYALLGIVCYFLIWVLELISYV
ncbi:MAG: CPBP family intramembrane metalloprotease [Clostridiales bacterium]|nr:CPBP family intramembrane metalloprotease [Clostridiales bacterium]